MSSFWRFLALVGLLSAPCLKVDAQVLVYEMDFDLERGFNEASFDGGYLIVPITGGTGSFLFTVESGGEKTYTEAAGAASFFPATTTKREQQWVVKATVSGDTTGTYVANGRANRVFTAKTPDAEVTVTIAKELDGRVIASSSSVDSTDASVVGHASLLDWKLIFRRQLTQRVNRSGLDVAGALSFLTDQLDARGFNADTAIVSTTFAVTTSTLADGSVGADYGSVSLSSSGSTGTVTWSLASGSSLPDGLSLSSAGLISGTPTTDGTTTFTVSATDSGTGQSDTQILALTINL